MGSFTVEAVVERKSFYFYSGNENHFIFILAQAIIWKKLFLEGLDHSFAPKENFSKQFLIFIIMDKYDQ